MLTILSQNFSLVNSWINELRNIEIQHDRMRFREIWKESGKLRLLKSVKV
jgi:uracil phosphoribosyltransferase